jgi:hypothetical protein
MTKEAECPCTNADCQLHGDCVSCFMQHAVMDMPIFCVRSENTVSKELLERVNTRLLGAGIRDGVKVLLER